MTENRFYVTYALSGTIALKVTRQNNRLALAGAMLAACVFVASVQLLTNTIDIVRYAWDFKLYIAMAERGFDAQPLAAPTAYRYLTPLIAGWIATLFGASTHVGFQVVAYVGAWVQLVGIFLIVRYLTKYLRGAFLSMLVAGLSFFNLKFLLFDPYRPDHLAYGMVLLASYFALNNRLVALALTTAIGVQIREFVLLPALAYGILAARRPEIRQTGWWRIAGAAIIVAAAVMLPRFLIPVTVSVQYVSVSLEGLKKVFFVVPFEFKRNLNLLFVTASYCLPIAMLFTRGRVPIGVEKRNGAFFRWRRLTTTIRPPSRATSGGMRHGQGYQEVGASAGD